MSLGSTPTGAWQPIGILCGVTAPEPMGVGLRVDTSDPAVDPLKSGLADSEVSIRDMFIFFCREKARRGWGQTRRTWKLIRMRKERILKLYQITRLAKDRTKEGNSKNKWKRDQKELTTRGKERLAKRCRKQHV